MTRALLLVVCGDIGEPVRHIELEPLPERVPVEEPTPEPTTPEPEKVPA